MEYLDFDLQVGLQQAGRYPVSVIFSPAGQASNSFEFPYSEWELRDKLKDLKLALRSGPGLRRVQTPELQAVQDMGRDFFNTLFQGEVRTRFDLSVNLAARQGKGLRVRLRIQPPELGVLPWEYLFDPRKGDYICLSTHTPVIRYLELPQPIEPLEITPPLRVLGMICSPTNLVELDVNQEKRRIEEAVEPLQKRGLVKLHWLEGSTWRDLQRSLRTAESSGEGWNVFHFIGHGDFDEIAEEGRVALVREDGKADFFSANRLARLLADQHSLRLVVLNACEGAVGSQNDVFSSSAATLVQRGVATVVAMQHNVSDPAAIELSRTFYENLAEGAPVDAALGEARKAISNALPNNVEWGTPVLFMRAPEGVLFRIRAARKKSTKRIPPKGKTIPPSMVDDQSAPAVQEYEPAVQDSREPAVQESAVQPAPGGTVTELEKITQKETTPLDRLAQQAISRFFPGRGGRVALAGILGVILLGGGIVLFNLLRSNPQFWGGIAYHPTASPTRTAMHTAAPTRPALLTPAPSITPMPPPTREPTRTVSPSPTWTPGPPLGIGSTQISPKDGMVMVYVPEGDFLMGSTDEQIAAAKKSCSSCDFANEQPQHTVYLDSFWIDQTEVTNAMYAKCVTDGMCTAPSSNKTYTRASYYNNDEYADYPVNFVDWQDAAKYCTWAGRRLPSEAEWEKAARSADGRIYPWGDQQPDCKLANFSGCARDTQKVGSYPAGSSPYGAFDMAGNVWEWVSDWYDSSYYSSSSASNPQGPSSGTNRVERGGGWGIYGSVLRVTVRDDIYPTDGYGHIGFRCAASETEPLISQRVSTKDEMVMVYVSEGEFLMGSSDEQVAALKETCSGCDFADEQPQHTVYLDAFWIDQTEVTSAQYAKCVAEQNCTVPAPDKSNTNAFYYGNPEFDAFPVNHVNWQDAVNYCTWAGRRLPSEAEWEKAARGVDGRSYPWGNQPPTCDLANFAGCLNDIQKTGSHTAGASPYGALDMAGNVWEWVNDWYGGSYPAEPQSNPVGPATGQSRVTRGGGWGNTLYQMRVLDRDGSIPTNHNEYLGFRCAADSEK